MHRFPIIVGAGFEKKKEINFEKRQRWLTGYLNNKDNLTNIDYDCLIAVSGGKDSHAIVKRLYERHGIKKSLLLTVTDEFTHTKAGQYNIKNLAKLFNLDHITFRCEPQTFINNTLMDFKNELHPLKWIEEKIYSIPIKIAKQLKIKNVIFGENSAFEYGTNEELSIFHPLSDIDTSVIFMGAVWPYSIKDSLKEAREIGFRDLNYYGEWFRQGSIEQYTQIDSVAYIMQLWTKFPKFGFQRVSDIACRMVREGTLNRDQAIQLIKEKDYICDPAAKRDFCRTLKITEKYFDDIVDKHANRELVGKDINGNWRLKDGI